LVGLDFKNIAHTLDATTIHVCLNQFDWVPFRKDKYAAKLTPQMHLLEAIPEFLHISDGKTYEVNELYFMPIEAGALYAMDRGYLDFSRLYDLHQKGGFFMARAKANMNASRINSAQVDRTSSIIFDQTILLNRFYATQHYPENLTRIRFKDVKSVKTLIFLTNNFVLLTLIIEALYKNRWQV
jgi:hypothetical protein